MDQDINNIYFDLDGPIIDVSRRYFFVHKSICHELEVETNLLFRPYWEKKRTKTPLHDILGVEEHDILADKYIKKWFQRIEERDALRHDEIFPYVYGVLEHLKRRYSLILVTLRRNRNNVLKEIDDLDIGKYFKKILVVKHDQKSPEILKYETIVSSSNSRGRCIFVGDTEVDMKAAKLLGMTSVGVLSGIRDEIFMKRLNPDYILGDIRELITVMGL